jgi:hypothetical protein
MARLDDAARDELVSATRTATGDSLRSVTYFTPADYEQIYLRSDLNRDADLDSFVATEQTGFADEAAYRESELGAYQFTIRVFEDGYITRVVDAADEEGVFVTTDALALNGFREVASALRGVLEDI